MCCFHLCGHGYSFLIWINILILLIEVFNLFVALKLSVQKKKYYERAYDCPTFWCPFRVLPVLVFIDRLKICISAADCRKSFCGCLRFDDPRKLTFLSLIKLNQSWMNNDFDEMNSYIFLFFWYEKLSQCVHPTHLYRMFFVH